MGQKAKNAGNKKSVPSSGKLANAKSVKYTGKGICKTITHEDTELGRQIAEDKWYNELVQHKKHKSGRIFGITRIQIYR